MLIAALNTLLERKLIDITGRAETLGSPFTYGTTKEFLKYFGINKVPEDLPRLSELEELVSSQSLIRRLPLQVKLLIWSNLMKALKNPIQIKLLWTCLNSITFTAL